jgi:CRP-like cAMP-binding protein
MSTPGRFTNRLLEALPASEYDLLSSSLEPADFVLGDILYDPGQAIEVVYFPENGVVSVVTLLSDGTGIEAVTVGNEGFVGLPSVQGAPIATQRWVVQVPDGGARCDARRFNALLPSLPVLNELLLRYGLSLFDQAAQAAACNALHPVVERCARWLLQTHDRMGRQTFFLTQEFLAQMLGVRRPSVSLAAQTLNQAGVIRYARGTVEVIDRPGLELLSCECYEAIRVIVARVLPSPGE